MATPPSEYLLKLHQAAIEQAVTDLAREKISDGTGVNERVSYRSKLSALTSIGVSITSEAMWQRVSRKVRQLENEKVIDGAKTSDLPSVICPSFSSTNVSDLSSPSPVSCHNHNEQDAAATPKAGRPKGSTIDKQRRDHNNYKECVAAVAHEYAKERSRNPMRKRIRRGFLSELIEEKKEEYAVSANIPKPTIISRIKNGNLSPKHPGTESPLYLAELAFVAICIQMAKICAPLTGPRGSAFFNNMIQRTPTQDALKLFQVKRAPNSENHGEAGLGWWRGFKDRHQDKIVTKRGEKYASTRADWTKYSNIAQMYDVTEDELVEARIASLTPLPVYTDRHGNEVEKDDPERFGRQQHIKIDHPEYLVFADETGCQTNMKKDGDVAGTTYICPKGTVPQIMCCTNDHRFTVLPFTSASGKAICCVIIFQSDRVDEVPIHWRTGIDVQVTDPVLDEYGKPDMNLNMGEGNYYPGGPKCIYNGKEVECLTFCSESGGITGDILVKILTYFDSIDLFPRSHDGPIPVLLVDGHQSRLHPSFIDYVNDPAHPWRILFGVPYATVLWQVGDASEQNGKFKVMWYDAKIKLMEWKDELNLPLALYATDIIPLMNKIFLPAYNTLAGNLKAAADRGWFPFNRKLLDHMSLVDDRKDVITPTAAAGSDDTAMNANDAGDTITLNISEGTAGSVLDRLISARAKSAGGRKAADERKRKGDSVTKNLREAKRLSAGVVVSNGIHSLSDPRFLEAYNGRRTDAIGKAEKKAVKTRNKNQKKIEGVCRLRKKYGHERTHRFAGWSGAELGAYLQYKKKPKGDAGMPKGDDDRRTRCIDWMGRDSPTSTPCASDDEGGEGDDDKEKEEGTGRHGDDAVAALLGMGSANGDHIDVLGQERGDGYGGDQSDEEMGEGSGC